MSISDLAQVEYLENNVLNPINSKSHFWGFSSFFVVLFLTSYALVPAIFAGQLFPEYVLLLSEITLISVVFFLLGLNLKGLNPLSKPRIVMDFDTALYLLFAVFLAVFFVILVTAPQIPIVESFKGADVTELSEYREEFLKARQGWEASLGYIIGVINGFFLPYFIAKSFLIKHRFRYFLTFIFFLYSLSFLEKAYFMKIALPIFFLFYFQTKNKLFFLVRGGLIIVVLFFLMFFLSGHTGLDISRDESFFSILYTPSGTFETIIWRSAVVPIVTAIDAVRVFLTDFGGNFLLGKTSSFLAMLSGSGQVNFERLLYQSQFGGIETGNANQVFFIEAYINFGFLGVGLFSFVVGRIVRYSIRSKDLAFVSIMPLFIYNLFMSGLIGIFLSNGLIFFLVVYYLFKFKTKIIQL
jgi:hypothetical protein